jgi:hypothetical protein
MMAVVIFGGELKLPSSFICGRRKIFSIKSNPSVVESIIPCQKTTENGSIEMKSCLELGAW